MPMYLAFLLCLIWVMWTVNDPIYQNTRRFVERQQPYFFKGKAGEGIGGPHIGYDMVWPMSIMMKAFTSRNDEEIKDLYQNADGYGCRYGIHARVFP